MYQALYRSFRPQTFADVVGQDHIVRTLENMLRHERIYHAFLFCGPRGTGKTTLAKVLAKALNCLEHGKPTPTPCLTCASCVGIKQGSNLDVLEIDGASNRGIDEIRDLRESVKFAPSQGRYKVYIIDEVHMLTMEAFNALLKTLEEPPKHVIFIFATTEVQKLPATILSRVQRFDFRRLSQTVIVDRVRLVATASGIAIDEPALHVIAQAANGGLRDALAMLDQTHSHAGDAAITVADVQAVVGLVPYAEYAELWQSLVAGDIGSALKRLRTALAGKETAQVAAGFIRFCRDLLLYKSAPALIQAENRHFFAQLPGENDSVLTLIDELLIVERDQRFASDPAILMELAFIRFLQRAHQGIPQAVAPIEPEIDIESDLPSFQRDANLAPPAAIKEVEPADPKTASVTSVADVPPEGIVAEVEPEVAPDVEAVAEPPTPVAETKTLTIRRVGQKWPDLLAKIMSDAPALGAKLASAQITLCQNNRVVLQFEKDFAKKFVEQPENVARIREELAQLLQQRVKVDCVLLAESAQEVEQEGEVLPAEETDAMKVALSLFEGQSINPIR